MKQQSPVPIRSGRSAAPSTLLCGATLALTLAIAGCADMAPPSVDRSTHAAQATGIQCYLVADQDDLLTVVDKSDLEPSPTSSTAPAGASAIPTCSSSST